MRAYLVRGPNRAELAEVGIPEPQPGHVRLRVAAVGLNHLDLFIREGLEGPGIRPTRLPHVSGGDIAGWIDALGPGVERWREGDRVVVYPGLSCGECRFCHRGENSMCPDYGAIGEQCWGGLADYTIIPASNLCALPDSIGYATAAAFPAAYTTAWRMLIAAGNCRVGSKVLVLGAGGGVATAALVLARAAGADVFVTSRHDWKIGRALELGAAAGLNPANEAIDAWVWRVTAGTGVDLVVDSIGAATWRQSIRSLAPGGCLAVCGATSGDRPEISIRELYQRHGQIVGAPLGGRPDFDRVAELVFDGRIAPIIDRRYHLAQVEGAFEHLATGSQFGKVLVECASAG